MRQNYYKTLGLNSSATADEIRRAYRILARRYHPDVNPEKGSDERFKEISQAYEILSNQDKRAKFDLELEGYQRSRLQAELRAYQEAANRAGNQYYSNRPKQYGYQRRPNLRATPKTDTTKQNESPITPRRNKVFSSISSLLKTDLKSLLGRKSKEPEILQQKRGQQVRANQISIIEVSVGLIDALTGTKKTIEIGSDKHLRKLSVRIPAGVRTGSVVRLRSKTVPNEDLILILRVASHPFLSILPKGLVVEIPITVNEAVSGARISVPTLKQPAVINIAPGTQSGTEVRLKGQGLRQEDGSIGDLFVRLMIHVPESSDAVGIKEKAEQLDLYYGAPLRQKLPKTLLEF